MRPTGYDQRQIDDEYCKDRVREADMARLALEAKESDSARHAIHIAWAAAMAGALRHTLTRTGSALGKALRAGREDARRLIYWATHLPRHT